MVALVCIGLAAILLTLLFQRLRLAFLALFALGFVCWVFLDAQDSYVERQLGSLVMKASFRDGCVSPEYPIRVEIRNDTRETVKNVLFRLESHVGGGSSLVTSTSMSSDHALEPNERYTSCWPAERGRRLSDVLGKVDGSKLTWSARPESMVVVD